MKKIIPLILILVSAVLVAVGCLGGQPSSVFAKAATVCPECIGIG